MRIKEVFDRLLNGVPHVDVHGNERLIKIDLGIFSWFEVAGRPRGQLQEQQLLFGLDGSVSPNSANKICDDMCLIFSEHEGCWYEDGTIFLFLPDDRS